MQASVNEGGAGLCKVVIILGDAAVTSKPRESSLDHPATRQDDEAFQVITTLDDLEAQHGNFGDGGFDLPRVVAIIRPDQFEPRETIADFVKNEGRPITILNTRRVNDGPYVQPFSIDERMDLAP